MARTTPVVQAETVTWSVDKHEHQLVVGTPAWYAWLEGISTFAFVSDKGTFTARKEPRQHGGLIGRPTVNGRGNCTVPISVSRVM
jgi:hypothetical protein